jgi:hypothetical protein
MDYVLSKFKIKSGKTEEFLNRIKKVHADKNACVEGIKEVSITLDCHFIDRTDHGDYLFIFKKAENHEKVREIIRDSESLVYKEIRKIAADCFEDRVDLHSFATFEA